MLWLALAFGKPWKSKFGMTDPMLNPYGGSGYASSVLASPVVSENGGGGAAAEEQPRTAAIAPIVEQAKIRSLRIGHHQKVVGWAIVPAPTGGVKGNICPSLPRA